MDLGIIIKAIMIMSGLILLIDFGIEPGFEAYDEAAKSLRPFFWVCFGAPLTFFIGLSIFGQASKGDKHGTQ